MTIWREFRSMMISSMVQDISDRTADLLALADVKRWVVIKTLRTQSVAEHSFNVAIIAVELLERLVEYTVEQREAVLWWSLIHDWPEVLSGDIDGKFKRDFPDVRSRVVAAEKVAFPQYAAHANAYVANDDIVRMLVKVADTIEAIVFMEQWGTGARADDVKHELVAILHNEGVPKLAEVLPGRTLDEVHAVVRDVLHHSASENNTIQLRRHRRPQP